MRRTGYTRRGVFREGGLTARAVNHVAAIDTSLARCSTRVKTPTSIAGASIPAFVVATEMSSLSTSAQHDDADTPGAQHGAVAAAVLESCFTE
jgi:hypothetical protein